MKRIVFVLAAVSVVGLIAWVVYCILNLPDWEPI